MSQESESCTKMCLVSKSHATKTERCLFVYLNHVHGGLYINCTASMAALLCKEKLPPTRPNCQKSYLADNIYWLKAFIDIKKENLSCNK